MEPLTIRMILDRSQPKRAAQEHVADAKAMASATTQQVAAENAAREGAHRDEKGRYVATGAMVKKSAEDRIVAAKRAADAESMAFRQSSESGMALHGTLGKLAAGYVGLSLVTEAARAIGDAMKAAQQHAHALGEDFIRQRDALREIASLSGGQSNDKSTKAFTAFNKKTAMTPEESRQFQTQFLNEGAQQIGKGKSLDEAQAEEYKAQVAALATAKGLDPGVTGGLAGAALGFQNFAAKGQGPREAANAVNRSIAVLESGKGESPVLARNLGMLAASTVNEDSMRGIFQSPEEAAIAISVGAEKHDAQSNELVQSTVRGLYSQKPKEADTLAAAGIDKNTKFFDRVQKMSDLIDREAVNKGIRPMDYLADKFEDQQTREGILTFVNRGVKGGVIKTRQDMLAGMQDPDAVAKQVEKFQNDPSGAGPARVADATLKDIEAQRGADQARLVTLRRQAEGDWIREKRDEDPMNGLTDAIARNTGGLFKSSKDEFVTRRMGEILDKRRKDQLGIEPENQGITGEILRSGYKGSLSGIGEDKAMIDSMRELESKGGNPLVDLTKEQTALLRQLLDEARKPKPKEPERTPPPVRQAGVPFRPNR